MGSGSIFNTRGTDLAGWRDDQFLERELCLGALFAFFGVQAQEAQGIVVGLHVVPIEQGIIHAVVGLFLTGSVVRFFQFLRNAGNQGTMQLDKLDQGRTGRVAHDFRGTHRNGILSLPNRHQGHCERFWAMLNGFLSDSDAMARAFARFVQVFDHQGRQILGPKFKQGHHAMGTLKDVVAFLVLDRNQRGHGMRLGQLRFEGVNLFAIIGGIKIGFERGVKLAHGQAFDS